MSVLCLLTEGLREDWLYQLSHRPKIKYLLTYMYLLTLLTYSHRVGGNLKLLRESTKGRFTQDAGVQRRAGV